MVYEVVFVEHGQEGTEFLLAGPVAVCARDEKTAAVVAREKLVEFPHLEDWSRVEVLVRPFCPW